MLSSGRARLFIGAENEILEEIPPRSGLGEVRQHPSWPCSLGFFTAWYMYIKSPSTPRT